MGEEANVTPEFAFHLGRAFASLLQKNSKSQAWVCRDARLSSTGLHKELARGLTQSGIDVLDLGIGPTPLICHAAAVKPAPYESVNSGIMITASHNPPNQNGFKILFNNEPFYGAELAGLQSIMIQEDHQGWQDSTARSGNNGTHICVNHQPEYLRDFQSHVSSLLSNDKKVKVVLDTANGSAGPLAISALEAIGAEVVPLFCDMDGSFPNHSPDTSDPANLADLANKVLETSAFCGIALDGDGDRMVAVTETGKILNADDLMRLFSGDVLAGSPNSSIVFDVKSSSHLVDFVRAKGGVPVMTRSGRSYIQTAMRENSASLAGEFSCHFFFADKWHGSDDGIYAAARLLEICQRLGKPLSEVCASPEVTHATDEISIPVSEDRKFGLVHDFIANTEFAGANLVTIDGLRIEYPAGWALVRASNTSAAITLRFEADSQAELNRLLSLVRLELNKLEPALDLRKLDVP